jgi:outer membrane lipoprotein-sorting protein
MIPPGRAPRLAVFGACWCVFASAAMGQPLLEASRSHAERIEMLLREASNAMAAVYDYRGVIEKSELFADELVEQRLAFKFARPFRVYVRYLEPHPGREGIYIRGSNKNRLRAHRGSTPDVMVNLHPRSRIAMLDNHHPITDFGLERMLEVASENIRKAILRRDATLELTDGGRVHGDPTWCIDIESHSGGRMVRAGLGESLWDIASRTGQDMYVILHHNDGLDSPRDVRAGQEVFVPQYYASRGRYFISKRTYMMIRVRSWDHRGQLYEAYDYPELELNPGLDDGDFDHRNRDYDFSLLDQR